MHDRRHLIACLQKLVRPVKARIIISESRYRYLILLMLNQIITALADHIRPL